VAVAACANFASGPGQSYVFSIFIDPILLETGLSRSTISAVYAVGTGVSAAMVFVVSRMVDRWGPRLMLAAIAFALGIACLGMSVAAGSLALFLGFAALRALGQGSLPITATLLTVQWFVRYRGRAMAFVGLGGAAANAILPPLVRLLIVQFGWRGAYVALALLVWVLLIPATIWLVRDKPEAMGLHPDGASEPPAREHHTVDGAPEMTTRRLLTSGVFWQLALALAAGPFIITALVFHQVSIFGERGLSPEVAAGVFTTMALATATTTTLAGFALERFEPKWVLLGGLTLMLLAIGQLQLMNTPVAAILYTVTLGAAGGIQGVTTGVVWAHYYGRHGLGKVQGTAAMINIASAALAPLPLAALQQATGSYRLGLTLMAALPVLCGMLAVTIRPRLTTDMPPSSPETR
jgi:MFS family permease